MSSSPFPSCYDVFPSFRGDDIRRIFLAHFLKELDRKMISAFKDNKIEKGQSIDPALRQAIKNSRIAVVIFSENYASSAWCLNEMLEIVKCKDDQEINQLVIPVFYKLDPSHVRNQTGDFGKILESTCKDKKKTEDEIELWRKALKDVASLAGHDSKNSDDDAQMIEKIVNDIMEKLGLTLSTDFENFVGIEDHIANMISLLNSEPEKVKMVGIWGPSGIGKTSIARALESRLIRHFQSQVFIDRFTISNRIKDYSKGNRIDHNMKLQLQEMFLSKLLEKEDMKAPHLGSVRDRLKNRRVLIFIDDLDDQMVLEALAGGVEWFGPGSRIIVITEDRHVLKSHGIECIYHVGFPSQKVALQIFCQSAFKQNYPPDGFLELASQVAVNVGGLPLGLTLLVATLRGRTDKEYWVKMLPTLSINSNIEKTLRIGYEGLESKQFKALFRHIACFFNGDKTSYIKLMLADSELNVDISFDILVDKSLIRLIQLGNDANTTVEMHRLVQEMGKGIVRTESGNPGNREFLMDSKDVCSVLKGYTGTEKVLGISLDLDEIDEVTIHEKAFEGMINLRFLKFYKSSFKLAKEVKWILPKRFRYFLGQLSNFPDKLKLLSWPGYPMNCMPPNFCPEHLVDLRMPNSKLKKLWEGDKPLTCLKDMDLSESKSLEKIPDLSKAKNLETLNLNGCSSLVELPSSIRNLDKLTDLNMHGCTKLKTLPRDVNLPSLVRLNLSGCLNLTDYNSISDNISFLTLNMTAINSFSDQLCLANVVELHMEQIMSKRLWKGVQSLTSLVTLVLSGSENLKELPDLSSATCLETLKLNGCSSLVELTLSSIWNLNKLTTLEMIGCSSLETLPTGINLNSLYILKLIGCSKLKSFPDISRNISYLFLNQTAIVEVPWWIENFSNLEALEMWECKDLICISPRIFTLPDLDELSFSECMQLADVSWLEGAEETNNTSTNLSLISFINCFNVNQETFIHRSVANYLILPGEVHPYFTHRSTGNTLTISRHHSFLSKQLFLDFKACVVVSDLVMVSKDTKAVESKPCFVDIEVHCRFRDKHGKHFDSAKPRELSLPQKYNHPIIFDCHFPLNQDCDQVEVEFLLPSKRLKLKGCGMRLSDYSTPSSATHQSEVYESIYADDKECGKNSDDEGYETTLDEELCGDNSDDDVYETALDGDNSDDAAWSNVHNAFGCF